MNTIDTNALNAVIAWIGGKNKIPVNIFMSQFNRKHYDTISLFCRIVDIGNISTEKMRSAMIIKWLLERDYKFDEATKPENFNEVSRKYAVKYGAFVAHRGLKYHKQFRSKI